MVENPQADKKYWYITPELCVISLEVTSLTDPCLLDVLVAHDCPGYHIFAKDESGKRYHTLNKLNLFEYGYEGQMDALNSAMSLAKMEMDSLLKKATDMEMKQHYLLKQRNAVMQK